MLSVCIPVYNTYIYELITELLKQVETFSLDVEIRVYDDKSNEDYREVNRQIFNNGNVIYKELPQNVGRSAIRNKLAADSSGDSILFLDGDVKVIKSNFLKDYYDYHTDNKVVVGGLKYADKLPNALYKLRWKYGRLRETASAKERQLYPYKSFMTGNVLIPRDLMIENPFDEQIDGYGHEDTKFGYQLRKRKCPILHIDNPVQHDGLETSQEFLIKTKIGIENLVALWKRMNYCVDFEATVKLLKTVQKFNKPIIRGFMLFSFSVLKKTVEKNLRSNFPNLILFDYYKLCVALNAIKKIKKL
ncbi:MAG TPA: glycosyltransferase [Salinivirgaceae bacterium]|nr:glycosyltransferase [Salinivirgaceae bacterium]